MRQPHDIDSGEVKLTYYDPANKVLDDGKLLKPLQRELKNSQ